MTAVQLVNEQDVPIGEMEVVAAHLGVGKLHRASSVFLFRVSDSGEIELLTQRRSSQKIVGATQWANTVCGNLFPGETYAACAKRRLLDELGIQGVTLTEIAVFRYQVKCSSVYGENEIDHIFAGWYNGAIAPNPKEVSEVYWHSWTVLLDIGRHCGDAAVCAPWFSLMLQDTQLCSNLSKWSASTRTLFTEGKNMITDQSSIVLVKIGGSLITDKQVPNSVKHDALERISQEVKRATQLGKRLVVGHGAGSFAHFPAKKYQTHKGIINAESLIGIVEVAHAMRRLNSIVMEALLRQSVPAVAVSPLSMFTSESNGLGSVFSAPIEQLLELGLVPVVYGDQILDTKQGCAIFSTERVLGFLAVQLRQSGHRVEQVIHCGQTNGVYDAQGATIPEITTASYSQFEKALSGSDGVDVTGGMIHKVQEALALAQQGVPGLIIDGIEHGSLSKAIAGESVLGTKIRA